MSAPSVLPFRRQAGPAGTTLVNLHHGGTCDVYIGRAWEHYPRSPWANPYRIGPDGTREDVIAAYRRYVMSRDDLLARLPELVGKRLGCWCAPEACHGDVLIELVDNLVSEPMLLAHARKHAEAIVTLLEPACQRVLVGGSIRRGQPSIGDIELIVEPRYTVARDLFEQPIDAYDHLRPRIIELVNDPESGLTAGARMGQRYCRLWWRGRHPIDLFIVRPPAQWGVISLIRTGPAAYSQALVTPKGKGGLLPDTMIVREGQLWEASDGRPLPTDKERRAKYPAGWLQLVDTPTEDAFYAAIGRHFVEPAARVWHN